MWYPVGCWRPNRTHVGCWRPDRTHIDSPETDRATYRTVGGPVGQRKAAPHARSLSPSHRQYEKEGCVHRQNFPVTHSTCLQHDVVKIRATWWLLQPRVISLTQGGSRSQGPTGQTKDNKVRTPSYRSLAHSMLLLLGTYMWWSNNVVANKLLSKSLFKITIINIDCSCRQVFRQN